MNYMIQGHRNEAYDYLFGDEWAKEIKPSLPFRTYAAFSRGYGSRAVPVHALLVSVAYRLADTVNAGGPLGRVIREGCGPVRSS
jgi:hypothetical protein